MKQHPATSYKRTFAALGTTAALALALTGCLPSGGDSAEDTRTDPATQAAASQASETSAGRVSEDRTRPASTSEASAPAPAAGTQALTPPGTKLKFGEPATTHSNSGEKGSEKYKEAGYVTKVTKIVAGSESDLAEFKDAAKFAGQTPYYVFYESTLTSLSVPTAGMSDPNPQAQLKDGTDAQKLIVFGTLADCKTGSFETEGKDDTFSYKVGSTKSSCSVFLAPGGDAVTTASFDDRNFNYENYKDNEYRDNPIVWGN